MPTPEIRIVVADDHPVVRDGVVAMLSTESGFAVVGQAGTGAEAIERARSIRPDVVLLDLEMPGMDGVETIRRLRDVAPDTRVVVFTAFDRDEQIVGALRAGAQGYILKGAPRQELFHAIRVVHAGGSLLEPVVASKLLRQVRHDVDALTARELEVLRLLARGASNKNIGKELFISERTVKFHVSSLLAKLGAANRTEAVALARERGLVTG